MRNNNSNIQGRSLNAIKMVSFYKELLIKERFFLLKFWMCAFARLFLLAISVKYLQSV